MDNLYYSSTRGNGKKVLPSEAIIQGIAEDGGLFVPDYIPSLKDKLYSLKNLSYKDLAFSVMSQFFTDFAEDELRKCIDEAYDKKFHSEFIAPLVKADGTFFLELFHGPTLAFKDMALSILPHLMKTAAKKLNIEDEIVILTATSGDTGKAALQGFSGVEGTKIIVFYPENGVSKVQKKQMITQEGNNTFVVGINGNFDDAQTGVKKIFTSKNIKDKMKQKKMMFSSANSINIGRLVPQVVYYFNAYFMLLRRGEIKEGESINFVVPTGNFGDILAGFYAKKMGIPIDKLICASNDNKVLYDFMNTGVYDRKRKFYTTISPSMDILISSNLERLIYEISEKNSEKTKEMMDMLMNNGKYKITAEMKNKLSDFYGGYATETETRKSIKELYDKSGYLMDTHTAVAYSVYQKYKENIHDSKKTVVVSTASPFKFTKAVMSSIDEKYKDYDDFELIDIMSSMSGIDVPEEIKNLDKKPVLHTAVCEKEDMLESVEKILKL